MTRFERIIEEWPLGNAIVAEREESFDRINGLFYAPVRYIPQPILDLTNTSPTEEWICENLVQLVRDEFGDTRSQISSRISPDFGPIDQEGRDLLEIGRELRDNAEQGLIYNSRFRDIFAQHLPHDIESRLRSILDDHDIGNKKNSGFLSADDLMFIFSRMKTGVRLVFPGLPFRDQNPLRTDGLADHITLSEVYCLVRLHCTALAIYQVLPTGADILILSDGSFFADSLGISQQMTSSYLQKIRNVRNELNLYGTIQIVELGKIVQIWDRKRGLFYNTVSDIESVILRLNKVHGHISAAFLSLSRGVRRNFNTRGVTIDPLELANWIADGDTSQSDGSLPSVAEIEIRSARYAALNLALKWHRVISETLPTAIRATVHPKSGQIGLPRLGSCLPWNGVAITTGKDITWKNIEVHSLNEAARRGFSLTPVADGKNVIYYRRGED